LTPIRPPSLLAAALVTAVVVAGCGSDESGEEPGTVADGTPGTAQLQSGVIDGSLELTVTEIPRNGHEAQTGRIRFSGPFEGGGGDELPNFDLGVSMQETGEDDVDFGMIATADAGYIEFQGQGYEIDQAVFERLRSATPFATLDPTQWFASRSKERREEIDGTETIHTSGKADVARIFPDLEQAARQIGLKPGDLKATQRFVDEATLDVFTGVDDGILRRLDLRLASHGSLEGSGRVKLVQEFSMTVSDLNEDQEIDTPEDPAPFNELVDKLPFQLSGLGEFLSGGPGRAESGGAG
jgi:hypothetical protein